MEGTCCAPSNGTQAVVLIAIQHSASPHQPIQTTILTTPLTLLLHVQHFLLCFNPFACALATERVKDVTGISVYLQRHVAWLPPWERHNP